MKNGGNQRLKWLGTHAKCERRSQARHFCSPAFPGLKERFFRRNTRSQAGKIVLSIINELVNLNLVKITV